MTNEYRVTIIGTGAIGKSALTMRLIQGTFIERYDPTIEDSYTKVAEIDEKSCTLDIMDTAGQEEYSSLRDQYMKTGQGFILVYSISNKTSFDFVKSLRISVLRMKDDPKFPMVLCGNKKDLPASDRLVSETDGKALAASWGIPWIETSAKTNENVFEVFVLLVREVNRWRVDHPLKKTRKGVCIIV